MDKKPSKANYYGYNKNLQPYANELRNNGTKEACLWKYVLRASCMLGYPFRRQRPVLDFIADFMCKELMLIIELDGYTHHFDDVIEKDKIKQQRLEEAGFTVLRFSDYEVLNQIRVVAAKIEEAIEFIERRRGVLPPP